MRTVIDTAGQSLVITEQDGRLETVPTPMRLIDNGGGVIAVVDTAIPVLTADLVREVLEQTRR